MKQNPDIIQIYVHVTVQLDKINSPTNKLKLNQKNKAHLNHIKR